MDKLDVLNMLENLELVTKHENGKVKILLYYTDPDSGVKRLLTSDYIDYTDIVRIVQQENAEAKN